MNQVTVRDWGDTFLVSINNTLVQFVNILPKLLAFALILIIGWFLAGLVAKGVAVLLRNIRFNELAQRAGFSGFIEKTGARTDAAGFLAGIVKWFMRLLALVVAFDVLGLPAVSDFLRQVLLWLPNLVVALVVLVIGGLAAKAVSGLVRGATAQADLGNPNLLSKIASVAVWVFAIIVAVNQIGIGVALVNTLFMAIVGMLALAFGLAFGLGGRDTAAKIVADLYEKARENKPKIEAAGQAFGEEARQLRDSVGTAATPPSSPLDDQPPPRPASY